MSGFLQQVSVWALPLLVAIILHEVAHGWVAYRLGDPTVTRDARRHTRRTSTQVPLSTLLG